MTKQASENTNTFNVNDLVIRDKKNESIVFRIEKIFAPDSQTMSLSDFIQKHPEHKLSKRYTGKRAWYLYGKYVDLRTNKLIAKMQALGGVTIVPVLFLKLSGKESKRKFSIINNSYIMSRKNEETWFKELKHVSILEILAYQAKINRAVKAFADHMPGDVFVLPAEETLENVVNS